MPRTRKLKIALLLVLLPLFLQMSAGEVSLQTCPTGSTLAGNWIDLQPCASEISGDDEVYLNPIIDNGIWEGTVDPADPAAIVELEWSDTSSSDWTYDLPDQGARVVIDLGSSVCGAFRVKMTSCGETVYGPWVRISDVGQWCDVPVTEDGCSDDYCPNYSLACAAASHDCYWQNPLGASQIQICWRCVYCCNDSDGVCPCSVQFSGDCTEGERVFHSKLAGDLNCEAARGLSGKDCFETGTEDCPYSHQLFWPNLMKEWVCDCNY